MQVGVKEAGRETIVKGQWRNVRNKKTYTALDAPCLIGWGRPIVESTLADGVGGDG